MFLTIPRQFAAEAGFASIYNIGEKGRYITYKYTIFTLIRNTSISAFLPRIKVFL